VADVFGKLNLKDHSEIVVVNAPASFESELAALPGVKVQRRAADAKRIEFFLAFVTTEKEVKELARVVAKQTTGDAVVWFAYPKGTSTKYTSEIGRDTGNAPLGDAGFEPVRMVAIDEDWTAKRFRRVEFIKTIVRGAEHMRSKEGRKRASNR
jgi:hypothetical protein